MKTIKTILSVMLWIITAPVIIIFIKLFDIAEYLRHRISDKFYTELYDKDKFAQK